MPNPNLNDTHDPNLKSWVESANDPATDFPIQNLPFCTIDIEPKTGGAWSGTEAGLASYMRSVHMPLATAIGDQVVHLGRLAERLAERSCIFDSPEALLVRLIGQARETVESDTSVMRSCRGGNRFAIPRQGTVSDLRKALVNLFDARTASVRDDTKLREHCIFPASRAMLLRPVLIPNYTDFYASKHHAFNVGTMFRPDNALLPNYKHVPIAYHGRASSIVPSGTPIRRPSGQQAPPDDNPGAGPSFGPCKMLDYEMELGLIIGRGNQLGSPIPIDHAREHIFGMCIVNDWSARDLQKWEYQPLGPFLAKNFATTISPFIVTMEALEPFRIPGPSRDADDPHPLPYLRSTEDWGLDITVEVHLASKQMRDRGLSPAPISKGNFKDMYWTIAQMVAHHASNGCNLQPGDLLASGTISGRETSSRGCLLEMTWQGLGPDRKPLPRKPISLPTSETRLFIQDGDEVIMKAYCERDGFRRIGFGECRGIIEPSEPRP